MSWMSSFDANSVLFYFYFVIIIVLSACERDCHTPYIGQQIQALYLLNTQRTHIIAYHVRGCDFDCFLLVAQAKATNKYESKDFFWFWSYFSILLSTHLCNLSNIIRAQINPSSIISILCLYCMINMVRRSCLI